MRVGESRLTSRVSSLFNVIIPPIGCVDLKGAGVMNMRFKGGVSAGIVSRFFLRCWYWDRAP